MRVIILLFVLVATTVAQTVTGTISGVVVDHSAAAISGAEVTLLNAGTGQSRRALTGETGTFVFAAAPPGDYTLKISMAGFQGFQRTGIVLTANDRLSLGNIEMSLGQLTETITVASQGATINAETSENTALLSSSQLNQTMVKGRDVMSLLRILPGVSQTYDSRGNDSLGSRYGTFLPNIGGARTYWISSSLDGQNGSDADIAGSFNGATSVDAIAEVKVVLNTYQAEYGRNTGPSINIVSKSGSREFHGSGYWYKRHEMFNANEFFNNRSGIAKPIYRFANFGFTLGGPVYIPKLFNQGKNKLFFFYSEEDWQSKIPAALSRFTMPTALERGGDFSQTLDQNGRLVAITDPLTRQAFPQNIVPASRINPNGQAMLKLLPSPNRLDRGQTLGAYNFEFQDIQDVPKRGQLLKLDYLPTTNDTLTLRPRRWWSDTRGYSGIAGFNNVPLVRHHYLFTEDSANLAWTRIIRPNIVNEMNTGFRGLKELGYPQSATEYNPVVRSTYGFTLGQFHPENNPYSLIPEASYSGIPSAPSITIDRRTPIDAGDERFHLSNNLSVIRGAHTMKFGAYYEHNWASEGLRGTDFMGNFDFGRDPNNPLDTNWSFSNAVLGAFRVYSEASARARALGSSNLLEWFGQDTWKATRRLTLNYGMRFSWFTPWRLRTGEGAGFALERFDPAKAPKYYRPANNAANVRVGQDPITGALVPAVLIGAFVPGSGDPNNGAMLGTDTTYPDGFHIQQAVQVAPRFGFAYDVFGNGRTAFRGGFGISKQAMPSVGSYTTLMGQNPPTVSTPQIFYGDMNSLLQSKGLLFPSALNAWQKVDVTPSVYNWSFGLQQSLGLGTFLDASYVGNVGRHLLQKQNLNTLPYGSRFLAVNTDPTNRLALPDNFFRPYPGYGDINYLETSGTSNYNALQVAVNRRFSTGLQFGLAYTWSKAMGLGSAEGGAISRYNSRRVWNYGLLDFDQTHMAIVNYIWELPKASKLLPNAVVRRVFDNWQLSGITTFSSGTPQGISLTTTDNADLTGGGDGSRVLVTGPPALGWGDRSFNRWFNTSAFARPAKGDFGNSAVTVFRAPGIHNWDINLMKNIPLWSEKRYLRLRGELYNAFNHTQYSTVDATARFDPAGNQANARFGQVTGARQPRIIQLSLSMHF